MISKPDYESDALKPGEAAWRIALLFPPQGSWSERDYFEIDGARIVEYADGFIEVHDVPTVAHQRMVRFLFQLLFGIVEAEKLGEVFFAPLPIHLWERKFREPDVVFVSSGREQYGNYPEGADLVIEIVSEGNAARRRDMETKVMDYARAGIREYWIVDPFEEQVIAYALANTNRQQYESRHVYHRGDTVQSSIIAQFNVGVSEILKSADGPSLP